MINGKTRGAFSLNKSLGKKESLALVKEQDFVKKYLQDVVIKKEIFVPGKVVNFVISAAKGK